MEIKSPWENSESPIWLSTTFTLHRNFEGVPFNAEGPTEKLKEATLEKFPDAKIFSNPSPLEKEQLGDLTLYGTLDPETPLAIQSGETLILTGENHLTIHSIDTTSEWLETPKTVENLETYFGEKFPYSYHPLFGYLTPKLNQIGTGLVVRTLLHVPLLLEKGDMESHLTGKTKCTNLQGEPTPFYGDLIAITNTSSIGLTEEQIRNEVHQVATKLHHEENILRENARAEKSPQLLDRISRAACLIQSAKLLELPEALTTLSTLKLAVDLELISGTDHKTLNTLSFSVRRSFIDAPSEEIPQKRALLLKECLPTLKINF